MQKKKKLQLLEPEYYSTKGIIKLLCGLWLDFLVYNTRFKMKGKGIAISSLLNKDLKIWSTGVLNGPRFKDGGFLCVTEIAGVIIIYGNTNRLQRREDFRLDAIPLLLTKRLRNSCKVIDHPTIKPQQGTKLYFGQATVTYIKIPLQ